jgi:RNA ligase (TIGR02306 family)
MKLASIETITEIFPHTNADTLEIARVLGWQVIVRKGEFKAGESAVFIPIDTILPDEPWSEFLKKGDKTIRLNTVKLRGQYSQGLVQPLSILPEHVRGWQIGADVGGELGVRKYEKEIPACLSGVVIGSFPVYFAPKTDEDNGLSNPDLVKLVLEHECYATLKLDGASCTIVVRGGKIDYVCSRNFSLKESNTNGFWKTAKKLQLSEHMNLVIQGELMGPGVQGNQLGLMEPTLYVYQIRDLDTGVWLEYEAMGWLCRNELDCDYVSMVGKLELGASIEALQGLADEQTVSGKPAEGIVVRTAKTASMGNGRPLGFKIINRNYKDQ